MKKIVFICLIFISSMAIISCSEDDVNLEYRNDGTKILTDLGYTVLELTRNIPVTDSVNNISTKNPFADGLTAKGSYSGNAVIKGTLSGTTSPVDYSFTVSFNDYSRSSDYKYNGTVSLTGNMSFTTIPPKMNFNTFTLNGSIKLEGKYQDTLNVEATWGNNILTSKLATPSTDYWNTFSIPLDYKE